MTSAFSELNRTFDFMLSEEVAKIPTSNMHNRQAYLSGVGFGLVVGLAWVVNGRKNLHPDFFTIMSRFDSFSAKELVDAMNHRSFDSLFLEPDVVPNPIFLSGQQKKYYYSGFQFMISFIWQTLSSFFDQMYDVKSDKRLEEYLGWKITDFSEKYDLSSYW